MANRSHDAGSKLRGAEMNDYMQILLNICFTMVTGVVIVGSIGSMAFLALLLWNMIADEF